MFQHVFFLAAFMILYIYVLYPLILFTAGKIIGKQKPTIREIEDNQLPEISIVVAAHNEEDVIEEKIENLMALEYPEDRYAVIVVSDSSSDRTEEIVSRLIELHGESRLTLFVNSPRKGKTGAINTAMQHRKGMLTVFTDANVFLSSDSLKNLALLFQQPEIGGIAGQLCSTNIDSSDAAASSGLYWRYEEFIKLGESRLGSTMGADGGIFAIRSELFKPLPEHVLDDFCTSMGVIFQGFKLKFSPEVRGYEKVAEVKSEEFARKVRIANRSYNSYRHVKGSVWSMPVIEQWKFFSHKLLRWYSSFFLVACLLSNIFWWLEGEAFSLAAFALSAQLLIYLAACWSWLDFSMGEGKLAKFAAVAQYFLMANVATTMGIIQSYGGIRTTFWNSASSGR